MTPLFNIQGNKLVNLNGNESYFYNLTPSDIEGVSYEEKLQIFSNIESSLNSISSMAKIYWLNQKLYLNLFTLDDRSLFEDLSNNENPLETFCGMHFQDIHFYENYLTQGLEYIRVLSFKELPASLDILDTYLWPDFVLNIKKVEQSKVKNILNLKRKLHYSNLFKGIKDIESENTYNQSEEMLEDVSRGEKAFFDIELFIILKESTKEKLDILTRETLDRFNTQDSKLLIEERGLSYFYNSLIPGVEPSFKRSHFCPSDYLSYLIPLHRDFIHDKGVEIKSRSNNSVKLNIFDSQAHNYNVLITGSSGQGKSVIANKILKEELANDTKAIILDLGNSFKKTTNFYNGNHLSEKFNPLQFREARYLKEFILSVIDDKLSKKEEGRLFEEIKIALNTELESFDDLITKLEKYFSGITYYFSEIRDYFTDEDIALNNLTYCDFSNYPEALKAPLIIYLIEYFKNLEGRKLFIFDECWHLLSNNAQYIAECFRTFRKYQASAIAISQNLDDFSDTQLGRVIIQNTYWKLLFRQNLVESEFIDRDSIELLDSIYSRKGEYSECLLLSESLKKPIRFFPTPLEYELFTSDHEDNKRINYFIKDKKDYLCFKDLMLNFTKMKYPFVEIGNE